MATLIQSVAVRGIGDIGYLPGTPVHGGAWRRGKRALGGPFAPSPLSRSLTHREDTHRKSGISDFPHR